MSATTARVAPCPTCRLMGVAGRPCLRCWDQAGRGSEIDEQERRFIADAVRVHRDRFTR